MAAFASRGARASGRGGGTARADISKGATWDSDGAQFLRPPKTSKGWVQLEQAKLGAELRVLLGSLAPRVAKELSAALIPAAQVAFDQWPIGNREKDVHSKELVGIEYSILGPTTWNAALVNRAPYAVYIRRGSTARAFIWKRGERAAATAARRLGSTIGQGD